MVEVTVITCRFIKDDEHYACEVMDKSERSWMVRVPHRVEAGDRIKVRA